MALLLHHLALKVSDLERAELFYSSILGLEPIDHKRDDEGRIRSVWFGVGEIILMLERRADAGGPAEKNAFGRHLTAFKIPASERKSWKERLERAGVKTTGETEYSVYFSDPEGNPLALSHYPEKRL